MDLLRNVYFLERIEFKRKYLKQNNNREAKRFKIGFKY